MAICASRPTVSTGPAFSGCVPLQLRTRAGPPAPGIPPTMIYPCAPQVVPDVASGFHVPGFYESAFGTQLVHMKTSVVRSEHATPPVPPAAPPAAIGRR
eukprot:scaffold9768_cov130-Isochrysis_galbana.AAC.2